MILIVLSLNIFLISSVDERAEKQVAEQQVCVCWVSRLQVLSSAHTQT